MPHDVSADMAALREWLVKEPYMPKDIDDFVIRKFLHSCYYSLERTKKCMEKFCVNRSTMNELFSSRDPSSPGLQTAFSVTTIAHYKMGENELLIHRTDLPTIDYYVFNDIARAFTMQGDHWIKYNNLFPEGHYLIVDMNDYSLKLLPKVNIMLFRNLILHLIESMPIRVKAVHAVNAPSYYDKLFALVKPVLSDDICKLIKFHHNHEELYKYFDKKYLPLEYGGDAPSMREHHKKWVKLLGDNHRDMCLNDDMWKADLQRKSKYQNDDNSMSGSFRTLSID